MKHYKKGLLTLSIISIMPFVMANTVKDDRIFVTTFADEDGENASACSLREAVTAAQYNKPYGGCSVGKTASTVTDAIVLKKGEYVLTRSLVPGSRVNITGAESADWSQKDAVTGDYPARLKPTTIIKGNKTFPIFDTSSGKATLTLNNVALQEGGGKRGGAIFAGGAIYLNTVEVMNSTATEAGGAIYLSGVGSSLQVSDSIFEGNQAPKGDVVAMSCIDNLTFTKRDVGFQRTSILNNGSANSKQVMEFCGEATVELINNTITQNTASGTQGSVIKFTADSRPNTNDYSILSDRASLVLQNNTIIKNSAYASLLYDSVGSKTFNYNVLAYNQGHSCRHLLGSFVDEKLANIGFSYNAVNKEKTSSDYCYLPYPEKNDTTVNLNQYNQSSIFLPLQLSTKYSSFMPVYFLRPIANNPLMSIDKGVNCTEFDQRKKVRIKDGDYLLADEDVTCDIGAIEYTKLWASDIAASNTSHVSLIKGFERERDFFKNLLDDSTTNQDFIPYYKVRHQEYLDKLTKYPDTLRYRQLYFDVFAVAQPHEIINSVGASEIQHVSSDLYSVSVEALGTGPDVFVSRKADELPTVKDPNLKCEWNSDIERVLVYRTDGEINQAGDYGYCKYTLTLKSDTSVKSSGILQASFTNIAPVAVNDEYTLKWGTEQRVRLDLLANDNDNGDGEKTIPFYPKDKSTFYVDKNGVSAPIKIGKIDSNLLLEAQYEAPCPDESGATCYGGEIYIKPKNSFNKFNFSLSYVVFDADAAMSNEAVVRLISTATTTDDTRGDKTDPIVTSGKSSGGSTGLWSLLGLSSLILLRRKMTKKN